MSLAVTETTAYAGNRVTVGLSAMLILVPAANVAAQRDAVPVWHAMTILPGGLSNDMATTSARQPPARA
jgi:hypothetical protein